MELASDFKADKISILVTATGLVVYFWLSVLVIPDKWGVARYGIVSLLLILNIFFRRSGYPRCIYISLALFSAFQYWHWRLTQTISFMGIPDIIAALLLVGAELYSAILFFLSLFVGIAPLYRELECPPTGTKRLPTVDIFIPTYNEPIEIPKITALAAKNIIYPDGTFHVYILDDGATEARRNSANHRVRTAALKRYEELSSFCKEAGVTYLTRKDNSHAKAGNLNFALKHSSGEIIAVLDCDHVPTQDFLIKTTHYFIKDPKLFLVQTPHFFINPDPIDKNLKIFYSAPSENEMFYRGVLPEMDFWNSAYFCGSAALLSRKCLETTKGFKGETVTEDAETAIALHANGFRSIYIPHPLVCGMTPDIFSDFISQKVRWAQGMIQIFLLKRFFTEPGLKWYQKICYFNCMFYWFFCFARIIFLIAPLFFIFFKLNVYNASMHQILTYTVPYILTLFITHNYLHGHVRWPLFSEIYEILQSLYILPAIIDVLRSPRATSFKVTSKGDTLSEDKLSALAYPFHLIFWALVISMGICIHNYNYEPIYRDTLLVTGCWIMFNIAIMFFTLGVVYEKKQVRKFHRAKAWRNVEVWTGTERFNAKLTDLSWNGAGLEIMVPANRVNDVVSCKTLLMKYPYDSEFIEIPLDVKFSKPVVDRKHVNRGKKEGKESFRILKTGCSIALDDSIESTRKKALLVYGDSERWKKFWEMKERRHNIIEVIFFLFKNASPWSIKAGIEFVRYNVKLIKRLVSKAFFFKKRDSVPNSSTIISGK